MADRFNAFGGTLELWSEPGTGRGSRVGSAFLEREGCPATTLTPTTIAPT